MVEWQTRGTQNALLERAWGFDSPSRHRRLTDGFVPGIGQFGQIAPDGLQRDAEAAGKIFHQHPALASGEFEDFTLS